MNIPKGWQVITLGNSLQYEQPYKYTVSSTEYNDKSGIPVLTAGKSFFLGYTDEIDDVYSDLPVIIFDDFTTESKYVDFPFKVKSSAMKFLKAKNENDLNLKFIFEKIKALKINPNGGDHKRRWISEFSKIKIYAPYLDEQVKIADILDAANVMILQTEKIISKYQRIKTGLMQDLFTKGIDAKGNIRSKDTHRFVLKNGIEVPEDWEVDCLSYYSNIHNNLRRPISALERFNKKGIYPYYGATGVIDSIDEFRLDGKYVLIGEDGDHFLKFEKQEMTHLVEGKFNVSNHAHILSGKNGCLTEWIHYFFSHRDITFYLTRQGAGRFKLNKQALNNLPVCVPSGDEQTRIIKFIETFNNQFNCQKKNHLKLITLKSGLMQDLLSGKVRVK